MPKGLYHRTDQDGTPLAAERFSCAPGPAGWRYVSTRTDLTEPGHPHRTDLTTDAGWRTVRLEVTLGDWSIRGGCLGQRLTWVRAGTGGAAPSEHTAPAAGFTGLSPAYAVATASRLALAPGEQATIRLVALTEPVLAPLTRDERWELLEVADHPTDTGPLPVERYRVTDLATGESHQLHLAGDVLLAGPGWELTELDSPPNLSLRPAGTRR